MKREGFRKRKIKINQTQIVTAVFVISLIIFNFFVLNKLMPTNTYYSDSGNTSFPVIYQIINGKKINKMFAYRDSNYSMNANDKVSLLGTDRKLNFVIERNDSVISELEYEVRDKTSKELLERTSVIIPNSNEKEIPITLNIQNLLTLGNTYTLQIKIDLIDKRAYYYSNILYKRQSKLADAIDFITDFTRSSFSKSDAAGVIVQYIETSPNRDLKQLYNVNIESSFEQLTWADTGMKLESDLSYKVYQAQDYCFNIDIEFFSTMMDKNRKKYFLNTDKYVIRWDLRRFYVMKFERLTEEMFDIDTMPYDKDKHQINLGITNPNLLQMMESENKRYLAFCKQKEIYLYDDVSKEIKNVYSNRIRSKEEYEKMPKEYELKLCSVTNEGNVSFIYYGYNMKGNNEGYLGISIYLYDKETNNIEERCFVPIFTTFQNLKYDMAKLSTLIDDNLYFKIYDRIYSININTEEIVLVVNNIDETKCASTLNGDYFVFNTVNKDDENIYMIDIKTNNKRVLAPKENETIEVIGCMNDDMFYGITNKNNIWIEANKVIGRPFKTIKALNMANNEEREYDEKDIYYYNFVTSQNILRYNKYNKNDQHFNIVTNGVIINNLKITEEKTYEIKEEYDNNKLRVAYILLEDEDINMKYSKFDTINLKEELVSPLEKQIIEENNIFYVYSNGDLISKRKNLADGISEIRDRYGYVKLNDTTTCYNRSNKANDSYLKEDDKILDNLEHFVEDFCIINYQILVMNITGVTERDMEYYISVGEKVAVYKNDTFQFFVTGYDNVNYVLEYIGEERSRYLTPRSTVHDMITNQGYISFAQLTKLD